MLKYLNISFILLVLMACDAQRFIGADTTSQELIKSAKVTGSIIGYYTGDPVSSAHIRVGSQKTMSQLNGNYSLTYLLSETDNRNKPVEVFVSKQDFYPDSFEIVLAPTENEFNFKLKYAAPIIIQSARVIDQSEPQIVRYIFQAIIKDYQGVQTIKTVKVKQFYAGLLDYVELELQRVQVVNQNTAHYQGLLGGEIDFPAIDRSYTLFAEDEEGYTDEQTRGIDPRNPDLPIF